VLLSLLGSEDVNVVGDLDVGAIQGCLEENEAPWVS
jgi:hypothetical protein